jgi:hypothetical protein
MISYAATVGKYVLKRCLKAEKLVSQQIFFELVHWLNNVLRTNQLQEFIQAADWLAVEATKIR